MMLVRWSARRKELERALRARCEPWRASRGTCWSRRCCWHCSAARSASAWRSPAAVSSRHRGFCRTGSTSRPQRQDAGERCSSCRCSPAPHVRHRCRCCRDRRRDRTGRHVARKRPSRQRRPRRALHAQRARRHAARARGRAARERGASCCGASARSRSRIPASTSQGVLTATIALPDSKYHDEAAQARVFQRMLDEVRNACRASRPRA